MIYDLNALEKIKFWWYYAPYIYPIIIHNLESNMKWYERRFTGGIKRKNCTNISPDLFPYANKFIIFFFCPKRLSYWKSIGGIMFSRTCFTFGGKEERWYAMFFNGSDTRYKCDLNILFIWWWKKKT